MGKQARHYDSLAGCLKKPRKNTAINDIAYSIINSLFFRYELRQSISYVGFSLAAILSLTSPAALNIFAIADFSTRFQYGGVMLALAPLLFCLYFCDQAMHRFFKRTKQRHLVNRIIMLTAPFMPIALDLGFLSGQTNILTAALFLASSAIIWPQRRKRNYYAKKRPDVVT
tara:strand:- start:110919 stop:111431 length:513 start_codon:yes stop_codon:yes gene_type:complete